MEGGSKEERGRENREGGGRMGGREGRTLQFNPTSIQKNLSSKIMQRLLLEWCPAILSIDNAHPFHCHQLWNAGTADIQVQDTRLHASMYITCMQQTCPVTLTLCPREPRAIARLVATLDLPTPAWIASNESGRWLGRHWLQPAHLPFLRGRGFFS